MGREVGGNLRFEGVDSRKNYLSLVGEDPGELARWSVVGPFGTSKGNQYFVWIQGQLVAGGNMKKDEDYRYVVSCVEGHPLFGALSQNEVGDLEEELSVCNLLEIKRARKDN